MSTALDHLVVAAATLEDGVSWCERSFGVIPGPGGRHANFGTHNRLVNIGGTAFPQTYLEIIAIDPAAPRPARPRWFGLDELALQGRLVEQGPQLIHAVVRSTMLDMHRWRLIALGCKPGSPVKASRDTAHGRLSWQILVPDDGRPDCGGALPTLIQWDGEHPTEHMTDSGVTLVSLTLRGLPPRAAEVLRLRGVDIEPAVAGLASLTAVLQVPSGMVTI